MRQYLHIALAFALGFTMMGCGSDNDDPQQPDNPTPEEPADTVPTAYDVAQLSITTEAAAPIQSKENYVACSLTLDAKGTQWDLTATARIRGRGNSSWLWYDKKPYKLKLDEKASMLGLESNKVWVLLANYRDPTDLMNTFVFAAGQALELPYTNHTRYVELTLNGDYMGLYQLTEQVEVGKTRVNIDKKQGYLIQLDEDDGPNLSPSATDNFWSTVYRLPICVKSPDEATSDQLLAAKNAFALLETAVKGGDYDQVKQQMDVASYIDYMILQELVYNVEVAAPRSIYMHKDKGGKWTMGPLWDFDAGYDFDWATMYTGHNFFARYDELVLGKHPATQSGTYGGVSKFFTDFFKMAQFKADYQARWQQIRTRFISEVWEGEVDKYITTITPALERDLQRWPISPSYTKSIPAMKQWLVSRIAYLDGIINNY